MNQVITFDPQAIKQLDGLYCLNDLHRMAGGKQKHSPYEFLRSETGKALLGELEREFKGSKIPEPYIIKVIGKGKPQGTYTCRELVYAYAMWIDPAFYLAVIRVFDRAVTAYQNHTDELNAQIIELRTGKQCPSLAGHILCVVGKHQMPRVQKRIDYLLGQIQLPLPFLGGQQ